MQFLFLSELSQNSRHTFSTSINQTINKYFIENWQTAAKRCGIGAQNVNCQDTQTCFHQEEKFFWSWWLCGRQAQVE